MANLESRHIDAKRARKTLQINSLKQFLDENNLQVLVNAGMNRKIARVLNRLAVEATGAKVFENLDRHFTKARWKAVHEAGSASKVVILENSLEDKDGNIKKRKSWRVKSLLPVMRLMVDKALERD